MDMVQAIIKVAKYCKEKGYDLSGQEIDYIVSAISLVKDLDEVDDGALHIFVDTYVSDKGSKTF